MQVLISSAIYNFLPLPHFPPSLWHLHYKLCKASFVLYTQKFMNNFKSHKQPTIYIKEQKNPYCRVCNIFFLSYYLKYWVKSEKWLNPHKLNSAKKNSGSFWCWAFTYCTQGSKSPRQKIDSSIVIQNLNFRATFVYLNSTLHQITTLTSLSIIVCIRPHFLYSCSSWKGRDFPGSSIPDLHPACSLKISLEVLVIGLSRLSSMWLSRPRTSLKWVLRFCALFFRIARM